jgi:hypothetical protein
MKNMLFFCLFLGIAQIQAQNPLSDCGIPVECHKGVIKFANDFLPGLNPNDCKLWDGACGYDNEISRSGNVTIGGEGYGSSNYKLSVWNGIISEQLKICSSEWCDYVFEDTFSLLSLPELSTWLSNHSYLPGCTPEQTIQQEGGYQLEQTTTQQQQKIEEIFLHLIALDQRAERLLQQLPVSANTQSAVILKDSILMAVRPLKKEPSSQRVLVKENTNIAPLYNCSLFQNEDCRTDFVNFLQNEVQKPDCDQWKNTCLSNGYFETYRTGNVCIGTTKSQAGYSLAVKGGISTPEFKIELCEKEGWCDYVFNETYPLLPLPAVEEYIKANKHLPGMISQIEVSNGEGYEMKAVKLQQQVKIEEAYLHLIELDEKKQQIQQRLSEF